MNTNVTFNEWTKPAVLQQTATKARILLFTLLTALAVRNSQSESAAATPAVPSTPAGVVIQQTYAGMPWLDYSKMPWLDYSKTPWLKQPPQAQTEGAGSVERLLADLRADVDSAASGLAALTDSFENAQQNAHVTGEVTPLAADLSTLCSVDYSTLLSQDLSVNYGQLLSTSLAVPTVSPQSIWNKPGAVIARTPGGEVILPTYPPRTAWGNAGTVVTTPGGAVYSILPAASETRNLADSEALRGLSRQLQLVQQDAERLQILLQNIKTSTHVPGITLLKSGNPATDQGSMKLPSDSVASH